MSEQFESRYFRGQGPLFLATRAATGKPAGLQFVGDVGAAELTPQIDRRKVLENVTGAGSVAASFVRSVGYTLRIDFRSIKPAHLARILQGAATTKAASSVIDESHTAYLGKFIVLAHNKVSTVVVTNSGATVTYVAGTDYVVHADEGMIEVISGGAIGDASTVLIDYGYAAQHHIKAAPANQDLYLVFAGMNSADNNKQTRCEVYKANIDPGVLGLISEDAQTMSVSGEVLQDALRTAGDQFFAWKTED